MSYLINNLLTSSVTAYRTLTTKLQESMLNLVSALSWLLVWRDHHISAEITKGSGLRIPFLEKVASVLEQAPAEVWVLLVPETTEKTNFCPLRASSVQAHEPCPEIMGF